LELNGPLGKVTNMAAERENLEVLCRVTTEMEASLIVQLLADCDIDARAVGGFTAGFRAEAPGDVSVLVKQSDLAAAKEALANRPSAESV
jgi:hypothetical protein